MSVDLLKKYSKLTNIASELSEEELQKIGSKVLFGFQEDLNSSQEWLNDVKRVIELASLKSGKKNTPLPNSANIKFPIITKACYEFSSRTYPEIFKDGKAVKARVIGRDVTGEKSEQANRVCDYMNYQLLHENEEWELETDRLLNMLALIGFLCKKTYYDPVRKINKSEICEYEDLIINSKVKSLQDARRVSHIVHLHLNDLIESARSDVFLEKPVEELILRHSGNELDVNIDVVESHCFLDLDKDDYEEPYIVTVLRETGKVLRIAPRYVADSIESKKDKVIYINPIQFFTDFHFLVSPKGKFHSVGFGILMLHINETINTLLNQLVDAGQLANLQGGFIDSRLKALESGETLHDPGEWKKMKVAAGMQLKDGVFPIDYKEPSTVLFQLLGMLIQSAKDLSSSTEVMTGASSTENAKTGAVSALIQEGMKVFTSIQKRIYRSLSQEYRKLFRLNKLYLDPEIYFEVLDDQKSIKQKDFDESTVNIVPVADPNLSSDLQRSSKVQLLVAAQQLPGVDPIKITKRILLNSNIENPEEIMISDEDIEKQKNTPNPEIIQIQADIEHKAQQLNLQGRELELKEKQLMLDAAKLQAEIVKMKSESIKNIALAEAAEKGAQLDEYSLKINELESALSHILESRRMDNEELAQQQAMAESRATDE